MFRGCNHSVLYRSCLYSLGASARVCKYLAIGFAAHIEVIMIWNVLFTGKELT